MDIIAESSLFVVSKILELRGDPVPLHIETRLEEEGKLLNLNKEAIINDN